MRWWILAMVLTAGCADPPVINCICASPPTEKGLIEGTFIHTVGAIEVTGGTYRAPSFADLAAPVELRFEENYLHGALGGATLAVRVSRHVDVEHTGREATGCCGSLWGDLEPTEVQPTSWEDRNAGVVSWANEVGDWFGALDPSVTHFEPTSQPLIDDELLPSFVVDEDQQGFVFNAWYYVVPSGCGDATCASTVRVQHHFRRP